jgi:hypothetical protein
VSTLVVDALETTLTQTINIENRINIASLLPTFYIHNVPSGTFTLAFKSGLITLATISFTANDLKNKISASDNYFWGWFALIPIGNVSLERGVYDIVLSSIGYTYSDSAFLSWVKMYDIVYGNINGVVNDFTENPYDFKILEYIPREKIK